MSDEPTVVDLSTVTLDDLKKIRGKNEQKLIAIRSQNATIDPVDIFSKRFELFLDLFLNEEQRIQFEFAFERNMEDALNEVLKQIRTAALTQGVAQAVSQNPKLVVPGRG